MCLPLAHSPAPVPLSTPVLHPLVFLHPPRWYRSPTPAFTPVHPPQSRLGGSEYFDLHQALRQIILRDSHQQVGAQGQAACGIGCVREAAAVVAAAAMPWWHACCQEQATWLLSSACRC